VWNFSKKKGVYPQGGVEKPLKALGKESAQCSGHARKFANYPDDKQGNVGAAVCHKQSDNASRTLGGGLVWQGKQNPRMDVSEEGGPLPGFGKKRVPT